MILYRIHAKATPNGFDINVQEILSPHLWEIYCDHSFSPSKLDKILKGRLYAYEPELVVYTYCKEKIDGHIVVMKEMIRGSLTERLAFTDYLLDVCK